MGEDTFEPKIIAFCCNWCAYAGADLAGISRMQYPATTRIIRVMCSGTVSDLLILQAFAAGADGVLVAGCHPKECHYMKGNLSARRRVTGLRPFLEAIGLGRDRLRLEWVGASEASKMAETVKTFTQTIKQLGMNPLRRMKQDRVITGC